MHKSCRNSNDLFFPIQIMKLRCIDYLSINSSIDDWDLSVLWLFCQSKSNKN